MLPTHPKSQKSSKNYHHCQTPLNPNDSQSPLTNHIRYGWWRLWALPVNSYQNAPLWIVGFRWMWVASTGFLSLFLCCLQTHGTSFFFSLPNTKENTTYVSDAISMMQKTFSHAIRAISEFFSFQFVHQSSYIYLVFFPTLSLHPTLTRLVTGGRRYPIAYMYLKAFFLRGLGPGAYILMLARISTSRNSGSTIFFQQATPVQAQQDSPDPYELR